ncbi:tripartite tricarboxylate transporter permease [Cognatishimia sp. WU-CL00825]|uniref:tripartite tricarboxylate transporter permease n=1 Tax=Cognatishimia sp. WU-CL00825 TaxID=3127658 RepID=UPI00310863D0
MQFFDALLYLMAPLPFVLVFSGVALGIVVGSIPGLTTTMLITLTLPLTFFMDSVNAIMLLVGMYVGGVSGSQISATLLRMPGTPSSIMTTFDGYPLTQQGKAARALGLGITASFVGGMISFVFLALLAPPFAKLAITFGPWEYFTMVLMALVMLSSLSQGSLLKGLIAACLGMLIHMPGIDPSAGTTRLTFGFTPLESGLSLLPVLIGAFAVSQIFKDIIKIDEIPPKAELERGNMFLSLHDIRKFSSNFMRSSIIGTWIGILPGIGSNIASMLSYSAARSASKEPEKFGTGHEPGVVAAETANNAAVGGALIPLITLGIPGSVVDAILIGALIIHNLEPGPLLFINNPEIAYGVIAAYLVGNIVMFGIMMVSVAHIAKVLYVPRAYLLSTIIVFCVVGIFAVGNSFFDVWIMLGLGVLGFCMERIKMPLGPFVIGFVLAPIAEEQLRSGLMSTGGSLEPLFTRPFAASFLAISIASLCWPLVKTLLQHRATRAAN